MEFFKSILDGLESVLGESSESSNKEEIVGEYLHAQYEKKNAELGKGYIPNIQKDDQLTRDRQLLLLMGLPFEEFSKFVKTSEEPPVSMIMESLLDLSDPETKGIVDGFAALALRSDLDAITMEENLLTNKEGGEARRLKDEIGVPNIKFKTNVLWNIEKRAHLLSILRPHKLSGGAPGDELRAADSLFDSEEEDDFFSKGPPEEQKQVQGELVATIKEKSILSDFLNLKPLTPQQISQIEPILFAQANRLSFITSYEFKGDLTDTDCRLSDAFVRFMKRIQCKFEMHSEDVPYAVCNDLNVYFRTHHRELMHHRSLLAQDLKVAKNGLAILGVLYSVIKFLESVREVHSAPKDESMRWLPDEEFDGDKGLWKKIVLKGVETLKSQVIEEGAKQEYFEMYVETIANFDNNKTKTTIKIPSTDRGISFGKFENYRKLFKTYLIDQFNPLAENVVANPFAHWYETKRKSLESKGAIKNAVTQRRSWSQAARDLLNRGAKFRKRIIGRGGDSKNRTRKIKWNTSTL